ncbi:MAG: methionine--tRNA ligase [Candidatus Aminicenantes bacterium]|nr:methionine--tRNA ligase [Candidatus Aminicenantes bacterium]
MAKNFKPSFYVTTPIYYVNDVPHIGHAYTTVIADTLARFNRLSGREVFFLTGTDEHGQKVEKAAKAKGLKPIELADQVVVRFKDLWKALNISFDFFIRTTQPFHEEVVQKIFQKLKDKGDIYKGTYKGWYCDSTEHFLSDDVPLQEGGYKICPDCNVKAYLVTEECYFFKLSAYGDRLLDFYAQNPEFVRPPSRMNEVASFVRQGLKDLSITRTTVKWGIPVPGDLEHTVYVWFDALHNYLTGIGYDWKLELYQKFWPATIHLIGKDILRFHAVFWPAFLMAADFPLPQTVYSHGWWLKDETKMSKSKGNVLDPHLILNTLGADPLRYFLLREIPIGLDGNFSHEGFLHRVNSDLANDLGNLVQRTLTMIHNSFQGKIEETEDEEEGDKELRLAFNKLKEDVSVLYEQYALNRALEEIWVYINSVNKYLADNEPWKLAQKETKRKRLARILYQAASAIRGVSYLTFPVMPETSEKIWEYLGEETSIKDVLFSGFKFENYRLGQIIQKPEPLFPRILLKDFLGEEVSQSMSERKEEMEEISFDEFKRMDLRVGEIVQAERVPGTDKLLKLEVDIGEEKRTMVAGVADVYSPEELTGKKLVVIVNLKPAVIRGIESQGMLLAAETEGKAIIPFFESDAPTGAKVK